MVEQSIEEDGELIHVHSESDAEPIGEVVVKLGRGRPRKARLPKEKRS